MKKSCYLSRIISDPLPWDSVLYGPLAVLGTVSYNKKLLDAILCYTIDVLSTDTINAKARMAHLKFLWIPLFPL